MSTSSSRIASSMRFASGHPADGAEERAARRPDRRRSRRAVALLAIGIALVGAACGPQPGGGGGPVAPVAAASALASAGPAPFAVSFSSAGSTDADGEIVAYLWNLGDGTTSSEQNPTRTYPTPGTYTVTLTVTDDDDLTSETRFAVTAYPAGDPSSLAFFPQLSRSVGLGLDRIAVWTCVVEGGEGPVHDPHEIAEWAQDAADDYLATASYGRYQVEFTAVGAFPAEDPSECLPGAEERTDSPFTNAMVVDTTLDGGGLGGPGLVYSDGTGGAPGQPPSESSRGFLIRGGSYSEFPNPRVLLHEIGHTLHWPHSFLTPTNEYDNPVDLMSGWTGPQDCTVPGWVYQCRPQHAIGFNRWAAGWIDPSQVVVHSGGARTVDLRRPGVSGMQLVVAPSMRSSQALVTVEARPDTEYDDILDKGGVAVHVVDQRPEMCGVGETFGGCPSLWRRQGQALGAPGTYEHVLVPGESRTLHGVTVAVTTAISGGYRVSISGSADVPPDALRAAASLRAGGSQRPEPGGGYQVDLPTRVPTPRG